MEIFVYYTPEATPDNGYPDCVVAIDVLRATSTIITALHNGAKSVKAYGDMDLLTQESELLPPNVRLRLGERGGKKVDFCDLGNSPLDCTPEVVAGKHLFMSTTNGTRTLQKAKGASVVLVGAIINFQAVVDYLQKHQPHKVWLVASGWEGGYSLEDTVCAGAIASSFFSLDNPHNATAKIGNDEVIAAISLYQQWQHRLLDLFKLSSHGQRLLNLGLEEDLKYCAQKNITRILPIQTETGIVVYHD